MIEQDTLRPEFVQERHLAYLEAVRQSGVTNMLGAVPYLVCEFPELTVRQARATLQYWIQTYRP